MTMDEIITIYPISADIEAFVVNRGDCTDADSYSQINVCHYVNDDPRHVEVSRQEVCRRLGISIESLVVPRQVHSADVAILIGGASSPSGVDGVVTQLSDVAIGVSTADCVPVVMADAEAGVIAAAHAGWRGAVGGIISNTLEAMVSRGALMSRLEVLIGPCICQECFEVGEEVAVMFPDEVVDRNTFDKPHVDLPGFVRQQLMSHGVGADRIKGPIGCTRCNPQLYFSARRLGINSGRTFTGIIKRNKTKGQYTN